MFCDGFAKQIATIGREVTKLVKFEKSIFQTYNYLSWSYEATDALTETDKIIP